MPKNECFFYLFSYYKFKTLQGCGILPAKTTCKENEARRGKIERQRAERGITEKALERWREMGGGRSLYFSAPFGSFIPQRLGFIGGSFNNKGSAFEMNSSCVCVGEPPFLF